MNRSLMASAVDTGTAVSPSKASARTRRQEREPLFRYEYTPSAPSRRDHSGRGMLAKEENPFCSSGNLRSGKA